MATPLLSSSPPPRTSCFSRDGRFLIVTTDIFFSCLFFLEGGRRGAKINAFHAHIVKTIVIFFCGWRKQRKWVKEKPLIFALFFFFFPTSKKIFSLFVWSLKKYFLGQSRKFFSCCCCCNVVVIKFHDASQKLWGNGRGGGGGGGGEEGGGREYQEIFLSIIFSAPAVSP